MAGSTRTGDDYLAPSFEQFVADEYGRVLAFARASTHGWSEAEDLTQEAFLAAYRKWSEVSRFERPDAFVRRVVANRSVSGVRRRVREAAAVRRLDQSSVIDTDGLDPAFWAAVGRLPIRQRHVVALHYLEDRSVADIAALLDIAEGTVKAHLHAARHSLAKTLHADIEEEL
ncbi:MAG: polymerase sigma-70 factor, subfamily [Actinomycetota bacterium]|jgi:RNA polymerase sigma-70 factor (ECF subfamily)